MRSGVRSPFAPCAYLTCPLAGRLPPWRGSITRVARAHAGPTRSKSLPLAPMRPSPETRAASRSVTARRMCVWLSGHGSTGLSRHQTVALRGSHRCSCSISFPHGSTSLPAVTVLGGEFLARDKVTRSDLAAAGRRTARVPPMLPQEAFACGITGEPSRRMDLAGRATTHAHDPQAGRLGSAGPRRCRARLRRGAVRSPELSPVGGRPEL